MKILHLVLTILAGAAGTVILLMAVAATGAVPGLPEIVLAPILSFAIAFAVYRRIGRERVSQQPVEPVHAE